MCFKVLLFAKLAQPSPADYNFSDLYKKNPARQGCLYNRRFQRIILLLKTPPPCIHGEGVSDFFSNLYLCTVSDEFSYGTYILVRTQLILLLLRNILTDIQRNRNNDNDTLCDILVVRVDAEEL